MFPFTVCIVRIDSGVSPQQGGNVYRQAGISRCVFVVGVFFFLPLKYGYLAIAWSQHSVSYVAYNLNNNKRPAPTAKLKAV